MRMKAEPRKKPLEPSGAMRVANGMQVPPKESFGGFPDFPFGDLLRGGFVGWGGVGGGWYCWVDGMGSMAVEVDPIEFS